MPRNGPGTRNTERSYSHVFYDALKYARKKETTAQYVPNACCG